MGENLSGKAHQQTEDEAMAVRTIELEGLEPTASKGENILSRNLELLRNVQVRLTASVGSCELSVKDLFALSRNEVLTLDKDTRAPVDIMLDGRVVARGLLVAVGDMFGVRITEILAS